MKSLFLELIPVDPGLDKFSAEVKKVYQIILDQKIIERIQKEVFENRAAGKAYTLFENQYWLISGKMDDEDEQSIWMEIIRKQ
ncbi:MAG TPA: hypothetical protein DCQ83_02995 [Fibrobacteres bacterium]|nr:hypothetical protein [Fibrobacterota bacterium]